jgi:uncharacterized protein YbjT (DUF2867 family)
VSGAAVGQHTVDIFDAASYRSLLPGHQAAVCTLGVGQPSKVSKEEFARIDRDAVITFATACKSAGVSHFELLSSVAADIHSKSFYLKTKGELEETLKALRFDRLSLFHPSMIMTPTNRYGITQAISLWAMPWIDPLLAGSWRRYRGIAVERLGRAMALNLMQAGQGLEVLVWDDFIRLSTS